MHLWANKESKAKSGQ